MLTAAAVIELTGLSLADVADYLSRATHAGSPAALGVAPGA